MVKTLSEASQTILDCLCNTMDLDLRGVCKCYKSLGIPVIPDCCECDDEGSNGEVSIHFRRIFDADSSSLDEVTRVRPCHGGATAASFRIIVARCRPIIDEYGEIPDPDVITDSADEQMRDVELMWQTLNCCPGLELRIDDISADLSEPGRCSIIFADITVAVRVPALPSGSS